MCGKTKISLKIELNYKYTNSFFFQGMIDENIYLSNNCAYDFFQIYNNEFYGAFQSILDNDRFVTFPNPMVTISEATLNLSISIHPEDIINKLHSIREHNVKHFLIKCLFIAPKVKTQIDSKQNILCTRLHAILYLIYKRHIREIEFKFSEGARTILVHNIRQLETLRANGMPYFDPTMM
jgi:hypothetical protein